MANSADLLEEPHSQRDMISMRGPPSIITIAVISHGTDLPDQPFRDEHVRMISFAGRTGSVYLASPNMYQTISQLFDKSNNDFLREMPAKGKKTFLSQFQEEYPNANKCEKSRYFTQKDGRAIPYSTYELLQDTFVTPSKEVVEEGEDYVSKFIKNPLASYKYKVKNKFSGIEPEQLPLQDQHAYVDALEGQTHRLHTPVINKEYSFLAPEFPEDKAKFQFGIYVLDICNYNRKAPGNVNIKIGENLLTSGSAFNREFVKKTQKEGGTVLEIELKEICEYLHSIGFHTINIIDLACRSCHPGYSPRATRRFEISAREEEALREIDIAHGVKSRRTRKTKRRPRRKPKTVKKRHYIRRIKK